MKKLPVILVEPLIWIFFKIPERIGKIFFRLLVLVNHAISFTLNIKLLFVPLFGDYTFAGRIIGFIFRVGQILIGFVCILGLLLMTIISPICWYLLPLLLVKYCGCIFLLIYLGLYVLLLFLMWDRPSKKLQNVKNGDILSALRPEAFSYIKDAKKSKSLKTLLGNSKIRFLVRKLELDKPDFGKAVAEVPSFKIWKLGKCAFDFAKADGSSYVEVEHVFYAFLQLFDNVDDILMSFGVSMEDVSETINWIVVERERLSKIFFWQEDYSVERLGGFSRGMTGRVTPNLDAVSMDFTRLAKKSLIHGIIAHQKEIGEICTLLSGASKVNVMIVGPPGSGKTSIVKGIAKSVIEGIEFKKVANKRIVSIETGALVSGAKNSGDIAQKFQKIMEEVSKSGDIILFFDEVHNLVSGASNDEADVSSVYSILEPYLSTGKIQVIAATNRKTFRKYIEPNGAFTRLFYIVDIEPSTDEETEDILKHLSFDIERSEKLLVTFLAIKKIVRLSEDLIQDRVFPDKGVDVLNRCVGIASQEGVDVTAGLASRVISEMTHIPVTEVGGDESEKLIHLEEEMRRKVIGQDKAVEQVSKALKRARVGIRDASKPIASFLFVGTTGVGKTETAKTLSEVYFGYEDKMIRLDMSEYQQEDSINRLLGSPDGSTSGVLTEAVRANPFSVVLLDEIEKASPTILLTFLQVLDDGRLTDSAGDTVNFAHTIIIGTSNVGTREIQLVSARGGTFSEMSDIALKKVREHFAPEFLNRFTGIIVFNPLSKENVKTIASILLKKVEKIAEDKDIKITFTEGLLESLVERGYNKEMGARPLARVIEDKVETCLADKILTKEIKKGDTLELGEEIFNS